jgi:hypothetical protein
VWLRQSDARIVSFWSADGVDDPGELLGRIADSRVAVGITGGVVPAPGAVPPPPVAMRMPRIIVNTRRLYEAGAHLILGTEGEGVEVSTRDRPAVSQRPTILRGRPVTVLCQNFDLTHRPAAQCSRIFPQPCQRSIDTRALTRGFCRLG